MKLFALLFCLVIVVIALSVYANVSPLELWQGIVENSQVAHDTLVNIGR